VNQNKIDLINQGKPTIIEAEIDRIIKEQHAAGSIIATTDSEMAVLNSEISIIAVGTPSSERDIEFELYFTVAEK